MGNRTLPLRPLPIQRHQLYPFPEPSSHHAAPPTPPTSVPHSTHFSDPPVLPPSLSFLPIDSYFSASTTVIYSFLFLSLSLAPFKLLSRGQPAVPDRDSLTQAGFKAKCPLCRGPAHGPGTSRFSRPLKAVSERDWPPWYASQNWQLFPPNQDVSSPLPPLAWNYPKAWMSIHTATNTIFAKKNSDNAAIQNYKAKS